MFYRGGSLTWSIKSQNLQNLTILQKFSIFKHFSNTNMNTMPGLYNMLDLVKNNFEGYS